MSKKERFATSQNENNNGSDWVYLNGRGRFSPENMMDTSTGRSIQDSTMPHSHELSKAFRDSSKSGSSIDGKKTSLLQRLKRDFKGRNNSYRLLESGRSGWVNKKKGSLDTIVSGVLDRNVETDNVGRSIYLQGKFKGYKPEELDGEMEDLSKRLSETKGKHHAKFQLDPENPNATIAGVLKKEKKMYTNRMRGVGGVGGAVVGGVAGGAISVALTRKLKSQLLALMAKPQKTSEDNKKIQALKKKIKLIRVGGTLGSTAVGAGVGAYLGNRHAKKNW